MGAYLENIWQIILMAILLLCSVFLSGSETAFSNISRLQARRLHESSNRLHNLAARLINKPKQLLTSLLFGNMVVNVLFFSLASVLSVGLGKELGPMAAIVSAALAFMVLLFVGEMLPKSLAYSHSRQFSIITAPFCFICMRLFSPLLRIFEVAIITPAVHLLVGPTSSIRSSDIVTSNQLKLLIESSRQRGLISDDENKLLAEVVEIGFLKVRHVLQPRVDMVSCDVTEPVKNIQMLMIENNIIKIPVYEEEIDNIIGCLYQRDLLLFPNKHITELVKKINFIPEQKTVESSLEFFQETQTDMAIVVDEYGGIAGMVSLENIVEQILGPIEKSSQVEPIEQTGPLEYHLAADLAIHDWAQAFGIDPWQGRICTIGGLATALLGKIPKVGDVVYLKNLKLTVEKVKKHRIESMILSLEHVEQ